ncbi:MAG TPA: SDR family oxidoreductase, partial [Tepidisphaeraceae bacterium]|nr:SDR family oxidoreductase [Tepidisphaeraceae bacterium]
MDAKTKRALFAGAGAVGALYATRWAIRYSRRFDFDRSVALITGGSRGLGLEIARVLADEGARIAICARDEAEVNRAADDLRSRGAEVLAIQCDVTVQAQVDEMVRGVVGHFGSIDVLINNAGIIQVGPMEEMRVADYDEAMKAHFYAPLFTTLAALPVMRGKGAGRIVNISSIGGKIAVPHLLPYSASKFALVGFSEGLRAELMKDGIYVTTVIPGLFRSGSPKHAYFKGQHRKEFAWFAASDVLPLVSLSVTRLAKRIVKACRYGQAELITPMLFNLQARLAGVMPGMTSNLGSIANRVLPAPGGIGAEARTGAESDSYLQPEF